MSDLIFGLKVLQDKEVSPPSKRQGISQKDVISDGHRTSAGCAGLPVRVSKILWGAVSGSPFPVWKREAQILCCLGSELWRVRRKQKSQEFGCGLVLVELRHSKSDVRYQRHNVFS